jgi:hypothetical protein
MFDSLLVIENMTTRPKDLPYNTSTLIWLASIPTVDSFLNSYETFFILNFRDIPTDAWTKTENSTIGVVMPMDLSLYGDYISVVV